MNVLNTIVSTNSYGNTGVQTTYFDPKEIIGAILVPKSWVIDSTYLGALGVSLKSNLQADTRKAVGSRIFPIFSFGGITKSSEAPKYQKFGYGSERKASDGKYTWEFDLLQGGVSLIKNLRQFKASDYDVLFCTRDSYLIGTKTGTADEMKGVSCDLFDVQAWEPSDGTNAASYKVKFSLALGATKELNEDIQYIKTDFDIEANVHGLINAHLTDNGTQSTTHIFVAATTNEGDVNLYDLYDDELNAAGCWIIKDNTGAIITPSGVAKVVATKGWDFTGTYATGTNVTVQLADATTLSTALVGKEPENGIESDILTIAIP